MTPRACILLLALLPGCATLGDHGHSGTLPLNHTTKRGQLVIYSQRELPRQHRLLDDLVALRDDVAEQLQLPTSDEPIHVYLFDSAEPFHDFVSEHYPEFPVRRAFFVETDTRLTVYAHWGDRVAEDLRHEVAHGYLHAVVPGIPLWLDEGLAEYFEVARGEAGVNRPHLADLTERLAAGWQPDLARLEALASPAEMDQVHYAEAWAWAHLLMRTTPARRQVLQQYLHELRTSDRRPPPLSDWLRRMDQSPETTLANYLIRNSLW